jgi:ribosome biogenesis GTPase
MKGYSGFYYVLADEERIWECSLRGRNRRKGQTFLPGDRVVCTIVNETTGKAVIENVLPRCSQLDRPLVANVDQLVIVMALANPAPDLQLLDRLLIMAEYNQVSPVICFNKADLVEAEEAEQLQKSYFQLGFPVVVTSSVTGWGIDRLKSLLPGKITVFSGPSGVGKSSLLNALQDEQSLRTGEVSAKLSRGRHTTRHAQLLAFSAGSASGLLVDTPGFSRLNLPENLRREELVDYYPDFRQYKHLCRFNSCLHREEPGCAVREAMEKGLIDEARYQRYLAFLTELMAAERRY